jgi:hypothetical protein
MAIFNEINLRRLINEKVAEAIEPMKQEVVNLQKRVNMIESKIVRIEESIFAINKDISFVKSLPAYQDIFRK